MRASIYPSNIAAPSARETVDVRVVVQSAIALMILTLLSEAPMSMLLKTVGQGAGGIIVITWFACYMAAGIGLVLGTRGTAFLSTTFVSLAFVALLAIASSQWSVDPATSFRQGITLAGTTMCAAFLAFCIPVTRLYRMIGGLMVVLAFVTAFLAIAVPSLGLMQDAYAGAWTGPWLEKNRTGAAMCIGALACIAAAITSGHPRRWIAGALICVVTIVLARSATSLAAFVLGVGAITFVWMCRKGPAMTVLAGYLGLIGVAGIAAVMIFTPGVITDLLGRESNLTGRAEIWAAVQRRIEEKPFLGYGYGAFWGGEKYDAIGYIWREVDFKARAAHNGWLDAWLEMGMVGLMGTIAFMAAAALAALRSIPRGHAAWFALPAVVATTTFASSESVLAQANNFVALTCYTMALAASVTLRRRITA
jgi:exopolysaccharide production protein ExoQ